VGRGHTTSKRNRNARNNKRRLLNKIPNNVGLTDDQRVLKALGTMASGLHRLVDGEGPEGFQTSDVYLRTAISIDPKGWANSTT
jgi:benzoyl-CoA 2,3-dioxygenase component B